MLPQLVQCLVIMTLVVSYINQNFGALTMLDQQQQQQHYTVVGETTAGGSSDTISIRHSRSRANRHMHNDSEKTLRDLHNTNETHSSLANHSHQQFVNTLNTSVQNVSLSTEASASVTHKIRMLHKKQVLEEAKRKSVSVHHRSLLEAEQLQGRAIEAEPKSLRNVKTRNDLDEVLSVEEMEKEEFYQNDDDEYLGTTLPSVKKYAMSLDYHISKVPQNTTAMMMVTPTTTTTTTITSSTHKTTKLAITKLHPVDLMLSQIHLPNKLKKKKQQIEYDDDSAQQQSISALESSGDANMPKHNNDSGLTRSVGKSDIKTSDFLVSSNSVAENSSSQLTVNSVSADKLEEATVDDALIDNRHASGFPLESDDGMMTTAGTDDEEPFDTNPLLEGVIDAANEDEVYDWDEISRNNRRNLMRGRDVVTKFLQIVETQHSLGSQCEAGTSLNLGEGVVDRYAQDRFSVEAEVAVNRANMLTRIFKMTSGAVQADVNLLHASVLSMVEFDDDIFAAGNCFDWNEHPSQTGLFCPFAYRLPPPHLGAIIAKDLANEYHYLGNTSEWFFQARKNAEKVIARNEQYLKAFHLYTNKTEERIEDDTLAVKYEDGRWSKPYYDCGGGNIWMLTYTVPFFGYENHTYHFKGTSGIDIDLRRVDIDQCPQRNMPGTTQPLNIFAGTDKCKQRTTMCQALKGLGFRRGSYKCICRKGYYFPDTTTVVRYFNGSWLEEEYEKLMLGKNSSYNTNNEYECLPCAEGCDSCEDSSPCIAALNWPMRTSILMLACTVIGLLPPAAWFTFRYQQVKVVRAASPALLRVIALGAFFIYCTNIVMYPNPNLYTCTARIWLREIGFSLTYGALMLKTWRISVIFRVRSAKAVKITDAALLKRLGMICAVIGTCLLVRTLVSPPDVVVGRTANDLKAFLCKSDWWDYTFTSMEVLFLAWGVRLCIMVRKAPSEFNESRFISMAIYNEFLLTCFLNVSMFFLQSPANPDLLYIIFFCHTQLTITLLLCLIFGSKVYIVLRSGKSHQESIGMGTKAKFNFRPQVRTFTNASTLPPSSSLPSGHNSAETKLSDQEALEEIRQLSVRLQRIQEMAPPKGVAVMTISSLLDGLRPPIATASPQIPSNNAQPLPLLANMQLMQQQQQQQQQEQPPSSKSTACNTDIQCLAFDAPDSAGYVICSRCLTLTRDTFKVSATCQELGSPQTEGSISFSKLKLDCMCSQSDDLCQSQSQPGLALKRHQMRSAATNTPPLSVNRRCCSNNCPKAKSVSSKSLQIDGQQQICDNCRKKYRSDSNHSFKSSASALVIGRCRKSHNRRTNLGGHKRQQSSTTTTTVDEIMCLKTVRKSSCSDSSTPSVELSGSESDSDKNSMPTARHKVTNVQPLVQDEVRDASVICQGVSSANKEEDKEEAKDADGTTGGANSAATASCSDGTVMAAANETNGNTSITTHTKRPDKLVLDLNDRSKYSKEVSV